MTIPRLLVVVLVLLFAPFARGDAGSGDAPAMSQLRGTVLDRSHKTPVEGALVYVSSGDGFTATLATDAAGRYTVSLRPGAYDVMFVYGSSKTNARVVISAGRVHVLNGKLDSVAGEVIVIRDRIAPAVLPRPTNHNPEKAPPYSDRAVLSDAWTKAWMLLDIDERGNVTRFKWLKRPGYDLEQIAMREVWRLKFDPARDARGRAIKTWHIWSIEWPSAWWLEKFVGTRTGMPPVTGFPPQRKDHYVPCRGSGPMNLGSLHPTYKDCSQPDLTKAATEAWIAAPAAP
jgi:hypothetical protein